jgi:hypothetical protein
MHAGDPNGHDQLDPPEGCAPLHAKIYLLIKNGCCEVSPHTCRVGSFCQTQPTVYSFNSFNHAALAVALARFKTPRQFVIPCRPSLVSTGSTSIACCAASEPFPSLATPSRASAHTGEKGTTGRVEVTEPSARVRHPDSGGLNGT